LQETNGDIEQAIDLLRKKGAASAEKKGGRVAADGLVGMAIEGLNASLVEVNAETDFVARNAQFQEMVQKVAILAIDAKGDLEKTKSTPFGDGGTVAEHITKLIATIGENMTFRRCATLSAKSGVVVGYIHNAAGPNIGKMGVLVALESNGDRVKLESVGKQIAMHIAATNPQALSSDKLDKTLVERERAIYVDQAMQSGKPKEIAEKMVEGRLRKFYEEVCLLDQTFIIDNESKISKVLEDARDA
jgi:elongation factor Ts